MKNEVVILMSKLEMIYKGAVMDYFKVPTQAFPKHTEQNTNS
jgi:hypothetical protein